MPFGWVPLADMTESSEVPLYWPCQRPRLRPTCAPLVSILLPMCYFIRRHRYSHGVKETGDWVEMEGNFVLRPPVERGPPRALLHFLGA